MSRKAVIASLAGAIALGFTAFSAQAASVPMSQGGVRSGTVSLVQQAYYRHHRYYGPRYYGHHRYYGHQRYYGHHRRWH